VSSEPINDGGTFSPIHSRYTSDGESEYLSTGCTMRDFFAAAALNGILANPTRGGNCEDYARLAYTIANAMLRAGGGK